MTRQRQRKNAVRETAQDLGRRYAAAARMTATSPPDGGFRMSALLRECATRPAHELAMYDPEDEWAPQAFTSQLLGTDVPISSVMRLAGVLADEGRSAVLTVEAVTERENVIVVCAGRRYLLGISHEDAVRICDHPACGRRPTEDEIITRCPDHLHASTPAELRRAASDYGHWVAHRHDGDIAGKEGDKSAGLLAAAAAAHGDAVSVVDAYLRAGFAAPEDLDDDDRYWDREEAEAIRAAMSRERARLTGIAVEAAAHIRREAAACAACAHDLPDADALVLVSRGFGPQYCSAACAPRPEPEDDPWAEPPF